MLSSIPCRILPHILGRPFLVEKLTIRFRAYSDDTETGADLIGL